MHPQVPEVLGYLLDPLTLEEAAAWILEATQGAPSTPKIVVTLNPETVVRATTDPALASALNSADLTVADGVGIVWAARRRGYALPERVPGVELVERVLSCGREELRTFFLGGRPGVAERAAKEAQARYGTSVAGAYHGYFDRGKGARSVIEMVRGSGAQLLLAGLGERQERFLAENRVDLTTPVMIGVGGTLDILAGTAIRAPTWARRGRLEWIWRVGSDPRRWHRIPRLIRFVVLTLGQGQR